MKKRLKQYGNIMVISFTKEEVELYGLVVGDIIDLDDMLIQKVKGGKKKNGN